jgi:hypothetical protein
MRDKARFVALVKFVKENGREWLDSRQMEGLRGVGVGASDDRETYHICVYTKDYGDQTVADAFREAFLKDTPFADVMIQLKEPIEWVEC